MNGERDLKIVAVSTVLARQISNVIMLHAASRDCRRTATITAIAIVLAGLVRLFSDDRVIDEAATAARKMVDAANAARRLN